MGTSREDIRGWLNDGKREGATHLIVVCDTWDHEDYSVLVKPGEDPQAKVVEYNGIDMQRVMECYALHLDFETQIAEHRSYHFEPAPPVLSAETGAKAMKRDKAQAKKVAAKKAPKKVVAKKKAAPKKKARP